MTTLKTKKCDAIIGRNPQVLQTLNSLAMAADIVDSVSLFQKSCLDGEIFTINRSISSSQETAERLTQNYIDQVCTFFENSGISVNTSANVKPEENGYYSNGGQFRTGICYKSQVIVRIDPSQKDFIRKLKRFAKDQNLLSTKKSVVDILPAAL